MKREHFSAGVIALLLSVAIAVAGIYCVATGFRIDIENFPRLLGILMLCVSIFALMDRVKSGKLIFAALGILLVSVLLRRTELLRSIEALLYRITLYYDGGYGWGYIRWSSEDLSHVDMDGALTLAGCLVALAVSYCILRRTWVGFGLMAGLMPLVVCCVVTDTVPDEMWLCLLLTGLLILLLTQLVRRSSIKDGNRLTALLLVPVLLCSALLFRYSPEEEYPYQAQALQDSLQALTDKLQELFPAQGHGHGPGIGDAVGLTDIPTHVDLSNAGPVTFAGEDLLEFTAPWSENFYLRGRSYDTYTGTGWDALRDTESEGGWPNSGMFHTGTVTVKTDFRANLQYFPYYVADDGWTESLRSGALANPDRKQEYSFTLMRAYELTGVEFTPLTEEEREVYLALPADTAAAAQKILEELVPFDYYTETEVVDLIYSYVRRCAVYSIDTASMPEEETDFAIWFLTEAESGYCVHFATAATVLLRAADIPARYVTGYRASSDGQNATTVTGDQAHAWVEYLHPKMGWTVLDPTPGIGSTPEPIPTEPTEPPTETTVPTETTTPTETTLPTETTTPTETTSPKETTDPTGTTSPTETTVPTGTTVPTQPSQTESSGVGGIGPGGTGIRWNLEWIKALLWILAVWAVLAGQDRLRKTLRRKKMTTGEPNRQAMARWKYAKRLSKLSGYTAAALLPLAEKAAFSQHTLTEAELAEFDAWFEEARQQLRQKPWLLRMWIRLVYAIE